MSTQETLHLPQSKFTQPNFKKYLPQGIGTGGVVPDDWIADQNFKSRIPITIQSSQVIGGPQTDFQMLVNSTFPEMINKVQSLGQDIRFAGIDKVVLPYQIEKFNFSTKKVTAWTKKTLDAGTIIYMYFNNPGAPDAQIPTNVWNVNNVIIQHLNETDIQTAPSGIVKDSTINANNFTPVNMDNTNLVPGQIDGGYEFNAGATSNEELLGPTPVADVLDEVVKNFTVMAWVKLDSDPTATRAIMGRESQWNWGVSDLDIMYILFPGITFSSKSINNIDLLEQVFLAITVNNVGPNLVLRFFADDVFEGETIINGVTEAMPGQNRWTIGMQQESGGADWEGNISENRVYNSALSDNRIKTIYNNEKNPGEPGIPGFYSIGGIENI